MKTFGAICYKICMVSILTCLVLVLIMIWKSKVIDEAFFGKALGTAVTCFVASGLALAINREFLKQPGQKDRDDQK